MGNMQSVGKKMIKAMLPNMKREFLLCDESNFLNFGS
jgi:hypothetical protein